MGFKLIMIICLSDLWMPKGAVSIMTYIIHYDISALILFAFSAIFFCLKKRIPCKKNKVFGALLSVSALSAVFDLLAVISDIEWGWVEKSFLHIAYYVTHNLIPFTFLLYILYLTDSISSVSKKFKAAMCIPAAVNLALIVTSPITKLIIYVDREGKYIRGPLQPVCYAVAIYYMIFSLLFVLRNRKKLSLQVTLSIVAFCSIVFTAVLIQILNPYLLVECFSCAVCIFFIMFTLQNQDGILDSSTNMLNRSTFINNSTIAFHSGTTFSILLIRIPDFAILMKTFGGHLSASILRKFADYLYSYVNFGNGYYLEDDCFALVFSKSFERVEKVYRKIYNKLEKTWKIGSMDTRITACFMRVDCPGEVNNTETLVDLIEQFKHLNRYDDKLLHVSDIDSYDRKRRSNIENAIDKAIKNGSFEVYYQPIYSNSRNKIISCEALVRLFDDEYGFIPPDEFIPISEENGKILEIGKFVFEEVCKFIKKGTANALGIEYIQVNLSVVQCMQSNLVEQLMTIMRQYDVAPSSICLEITETSAAYTPHVMEKNIKNLSDLGVKFALDDYGTGYSNMTYLLKLPFRFIKLEKEIVWAGFNSDKAHIAIESTVAMIKKLNMHIVAEGVETIEQLESLLDMGCDYIQGYYFSKPVPEKEFIDLLKRLVDNI